MPVSIAFAATSVQPIRATISGSRSTEPRGGALPRIIDWRMYCLLQAKRMNSRDQSAFLVYFGMPSEWPSTQVLLCAFAVLPGTVSQIHLPPVLDNFGLLIS